MTVEELCELSVDGMYSNIVQDKITETEFYVWMSHRLKLAHDMGHSEGREEGFDAGYSEGYDAGRNEYFD